MKRVVILVSTLKIGGAEKQSVYLLNALKDTCETTLIVFHGAVIDYKNIQMIDGSNYKLIKLNGSLFKKLLFLYKYFKSNQITHLFSYLTKLNFYGDFIGRFAVIKYIYANIRTSKLPFWKIFLENISSNYFSTATIFNSYSGENIFRRKGIKNGIVIPNCFPEISNAHNREQKEIIKIITVGRFVKEKDYFTAIRAIKKLKENRDNFIFQIVGYGKFEKQIRNKIIELGLTDNVEIFINPANIPELLDNADIYLSTSLFEGTSNSIMEAMNACLPIVATNVGDNSRLISEGVSGFLHDVGDHVSIAHSLEELINDYEQRIKYGLASHKILNKNYSFEKYQQNYFSLINQS